MLLRLQNAKGKGCVQQDTGSLDITEIIDFKTGKVADLMN